MRWLTCSSRGDHLVRLARDDEVSTSCSRGVSAANPGLQTRARLLSNSRPTRSFSIALCDPIQQVLIAERFLQEVHGTVLHGLHCHGDVTVSRDEDDRHQRAARIELLLQLQAAHARHADIKHEATPALGVEVGQELLRRAISQGRHAQCLQQQFHRAAYGFIVIHDAYGSWLFLHSGSPGTTAT